MKQPPALSTEQITRLDTIAGLGGAKIADSLSKWTGSRIITSHSTASIVHYSKLLESSTSPEDIMTAILIRISGNISGYLIFLFDEESTIKIVRHILRKKTDPLLEWDDLTRSVIEETGNIIGTAFLNTLAANLGIEAHPSSPVVTCDLSGAIRESIMAQFALHGEYALNCQIHFSSSNNNIRGSISMLPDDIDAWRFI